MAEITRTTAKTYFNTGDTPTEAQFANVWDSVPFPASDAVFTALSGTAWDGSFKSLTLTGNTALTFASTKRSGVLLVKQDATGSRTLTINGSSAAINSAANSTSIITFLYNDVISDYVFCVETLVVGVTGGLDTTAPALLSAVVSNAAPSNLVLTYNETLDAASTPATTDFDIHVNGVSRNRDSVNISGSIITIHLVSPVVFGDTVQVSYLAGGVYKIQDVAGNDAAAFIDTAVTNNVAAGDTTAPTVVSKNTTSTTNIRIVFSEAVTATLPGWSFKKNGSALAASAISGSGTTWDFTVATMASGDTLLVSYDPATGATVDGSGNEVASITDSAVTNNIIAASIKSLAAWKQYNEADSGVTQSGGLVSVVADQIVAGGNTTYDLVQATGANQPAYVASALNGHPGINIDTSKSLVQRAALADAPRPLVRAALVVFTAINTGGTYNYVGYFSGGSSRCDFGLDNTGKPFMYSGTLLVGTTALVINTPYWFWCEYESGGTGKLYVNNVLVVSGSTGAHTTYNGGGIGDAADSAKAYVMLNGYIDSLPGGTVRTDVYNAVKAKYGF